jgi:hypothetical protein
VVAYNFQERFAADVESGKKHQTIRANGKRRHAKQGDALQLYTGQRTKKCRKLRDATCHDACLIKLYSSHAITFCPQEIHTGEALERLAQQDGFASWSEMRDWFAAVHGLPFSGTMICWLAPL